MAFGSIYGPVFLHGRLIVAVPGTPVSFSQNFPTTIVGASGTSVQMASNQIILVAPHSNVGTVYLVFRGGAKTNVNSIIKDFVPGETFVLGTSGAHSPYRPFDLQVDADTANDSLNATSIVI